MDDERHGRDRGLADEDIRYVKTNAVPYFPSLVVCGKQDCEQFTELDRFFLLAQRGSDQFVRLP